MMEVKCLALKDLSSPRKHARIDLVEDGTENEQKENICTERRKSTPLKAESTVPIFFFNSKVPTPELAHITPIKHPDRGLHAEPWTPTANLKMLISAASPDIRDREMRKVLFRPIENERENSTLPEDAKVEESCQSDQLDVMDEGTEEDGETKPKHILVDRKQKSLGLLCQKFLALYPDYPPANEAIRISLDEVATSLSVGRRRIYDIINVLESLMIVGRIAKNRYTWYGRQRLRATLEELQRQGRQQGYHLQMEQAAEGREVGTGVEAGDTESCNGAASNRKDKSLRIMSQKFVMLFLVSKTHTVTLDLAAKILIEESQDSSSHSKYKTKVRRLYDIANVLTSLGLIKKVHVREEWGRKPAFQWIGPVDFTNADENRVNEAAVGPFSWGGQTVRQLIDQTKPKLARYASFNITPTSAASQRLVNSAPSSPRREQTSLVPQPVDYSIRTTSNSTVYQLQFGKSTDDQLSAGVQTYTHSSNNPLIHASGQFSPLAVPLHPQGPFAAPSHQHHPHLAYLSSLSQPSVVMLYGAETLEPPASAPEEWGKRGRDEEEEEKRSVKKRGKSDKPSAEAQREARDESQMSRAETPPRSPEAPAMASSDREVGACKPTHLGQHYLYVPNNAAGLNFLLPAGQSPGGLALPPGAMPTLALPYVLVPSSALSHYPLLANGLQHTEADAHGNLNFTLPAMVSPAHFMVGTAPYAIAGSSEISMSSVPTPSTPEQSRQYGPHSPQGSSQPIGITITEPLTPHTQKEAVAPGSKAFFQTPGTLGGVVNATPVARKRGSAQRRLDIGHQPAN